MLIITRQEEFSDAINFASLQNNIKLEINFTWRTIKKYGFKFLERVRIDDSRVVTILGEYEDALVWWENNEVKFIDPLSNDGIKIISKGKYQIVDNDYPNEIVRHFEEAYDCKFEEFLERVYAIPWMTDYFFKQVFVQKNIYIYSNDGKLAQKSFKNYFFDYPKEFKYNFDKIFDDYSAYFSTLEVTEMPAFSASIENLDKRSTLPTALQSLAKEIEALNRELIIKEQELNSQEQELNYKIYVDNTIFLCEFLLSVVPEKERRKLYDVYLMILPKLAEMIYLHGEKFLSEHRVRKYCWAFYILAGHADAKDEGCMRANYFMLMKLSPQGPGSIFDYFANYPKEYINMFHNVLNTNENDAGLFALIDPLIANGHLLAKFEKAKLYFYLAKAYQATNQSEQANTTLLLVKQFVIELLKSGFTDTIEFAEANMNDDLDVAIAIIDCYQLAHNGQNFIKSLRRAVNIHLNQNGNDQVLSIAEIMSLESQYKNRKDLLNLGLVYLYGIDVKSRPDLASQYLTAYLDKNNDLEKKVEIAEYVLTQEIQMAVDPFELLIDAVKNRHNFDVKAKALSVLSKFKHKINESQHANALVILKAEGLNKIDNETLRLFFICFKHDPHTFLQILEKVRRFASNIVYALPKDQINIAQFLAFMINNDQENAQEYLNLLKEDDELMLIFLKNHEAFNSLLKVQIWRSFINSNSEWQRLLNMLVKNKIYSKDTVDNSKLIFLKAKNEFVDHLFTQIHKWFIERKTEISNLLNIQAEQNNNATNSDSIFKEFNEATNMAKLEAFVEKYSLTQSNAANFKKLQLQ